ncbi:MULTISPECIES: hypothetical protein [Rhizobium/Agrobacterium group]|uniref:hypothetical protein n=1 Tax=Rhizobium/Agrobacterium group TaxID=227290 RepID=UPI001F32889E|nr:MULTISPECIES: hypothetical protein [Rhizobium/Agrobacterium group]
MKFQITSRREFERLASVEPSTLTDLERAARFLYLQRLAFGGKIMSRGFGVDTTGPARFNLNRLAPLLISAVAMTSLARCSFSTRLTTVMKAIMAKMLSTATDLQTWQIF